MRSEADISIGRIRSVEVLRGLAALAVTWFHLTNTYDAHWVRESGRFGWLGVEVFLSYLGSSFHFLLFEATENFSFADFWHYLLRRMARLEPPYIISVLLVVCLWELSAQAPGFAGASPDWSLLQILSHIAYAIPLTSFDWLQPVYWTLAYEFVFYILAGLLFTVIGHLDFNRWPLLAALVIIASLGGFLPPLGLLFIMGIAVFRRIALFEGRLKTILVLAASGGAMAILEHGLQASVGILTSLCILITASLNLTTRVWRPFLWLGTISHSLYLVHIPVGGRVVNLLGRFIPTRLLPI